MDKSKPTNASDAKDANKLTKEQLAKDGDKANSVELDELLEKATPSSAKDDLQDLPKVKHRHRYHRTWQQFKPYRKTKHPEDFPIHNVGCFSYLTYSWLTSFSWKLFRSSTLDMDSVWSMPKEDGSAYCGARLNRIWQEELEKKGKEAASMGKVMFKFCLTRTVVCMILYLINIFFSFLGSTYLLREILEYNSSEDEKMWYGVTLCVALFATEIGKCLSVGLLMVVSLETAKRAKGAMLHVLFDKLMKLKSLKDKSVGEVVNLCTNDSQRLVDTLYFVHYVVGGPVMVIVGTVYCCNLLGLWALLGAAIILLYYPYQYFVSRLTAVLRREAVVITDKRVRMMNEILTCIKLIKLYAWEKPFSASVSEVRSNERRVLERAAFLHTMSAAVSPVVPVMAAVCTFVAHVMCGNSLSVSQAFVIITIYHLTRIKLTYVPLFVAAYADSRVAMERLETYMFMEEVNPDYSPIKDPDNAIEISNATFAWPVSVKVDKTDDEETEDKKDTVEKQPESSKVNVENGRLLNTGDEEPESLSTALLNINLNIPKGHLYGVCGKVGSGKSSLIAGLLGQMTRTEGSVGLDGRLAYVPQQAWIINDTVKENVLFGLPYDKARYDSALDLCCLKSDLKILPAGERTEIGERGITLSGGQKQRISLARAVYSDRDIFLLDDPLSAVDAHVGQSLFEDCFKKGLHDKTLLFITHQLQYLQRCDYILHMKEGQIWEQGTHQELMELGGEYATLIKTFHSTENVEKEPTEVVEGLASSQHRHKKTQLGKILEEDSRERTSSMLSVASEVKSEAEMDEQDAGKLMTDEDRESGSVAVDTYFSYIKAAGGFIIAAIHIVLFALPVACVGFNHWWLSYWLDQGAGDGFVFSNSSNATNETQEVEDPHDISKNPDLYYYAIIYGMSAVAIVIALAMRGFVHMKVTLRASSRLHNKVFAKVLRCPMSFFDTTPVGRIVNRFSRDLDEVDVRLPMRIEAILGNLMNLAMALVIIGSVFPWFLLSLFPVGIIFGYAYRIMHTCLREVKRVENISRSPYLSHLSAGVQGVQTIQAYNRQHHFLTKFHHLLDYNSVIHFLFVHINRWIAIRMDLLSVSLTLLTGLFVVIFKDMVSPAYAGLALAYGITITGNFQITLRIMADADAHFVSVQRIIFYIENVAAEAASIVANNRPPTDWPQEGAVVFKDYHMRYRPKLPLALNGIDCDIKPKEKIGIVGRTGSGKSSLAVGLFRLVEPDSGSIHVDRIETTGLGLEDLRSRLSIIPQDPVLFVGTIRYNLDPFKDRSDSALWKALEQCHMKDVVAAMEGQLDAPVIENGENFSVGERQLICMARALLRHSRILLLDEATASIDTETDSKIQRTINEAFAECTMLTIAHRLNTIVHCDRILVLQNGKIVEFDKPSTLLGDPTSKFSQMMAATDMSIPSVHPKEDDNEALAR